MHSNQFLRVIDTLTESDGCWEWPMARTRRGGYGHLTYGTSQRRANRVAFELLVRPLRAGEVVMHTCDNPACVNPSHLRAGTQHENIADREAKGRSFAGKTACRAGHPYVDGSFVWRVQHGYVGRTCLICRREKERARYVPTGRPRGRPKKA